MVFSLRRASIFRPLAAKMEKECIAHITKSVANNASPGPAYYNTRGDFGKDVPPITMRGRHTQRTETLQPNLYNPPSSFGKVPAIHLAGRTATRGTFQTPGPSYIPPSFGSGARKIGMAPPPVSDTMKKRSGSQRAMSLLDYRKRADMTPGPGPAAYDVREKTFGGKGKGVSMKGHHDFKYSDTDSPGPGAYKPNYKAVFPESPKASFHSRPVEKPPAVTPGYRSLGSTLGGVSYTMKGRASDDIQLI